MKEHYDGITPDQRYKNDVLNELRQIRQLLERNGQALETPIETNKRRQRREDKEQTT